jgi:hypothetical protein
MSDAGESGMYVAELWRFPVKSLRGKRLERAQLSADGVAGDRLVHVRTASGVLTGRTRHALLGLAASTGPDGPLVEGIAWSDRRAAELVREAAGEGASLAAYAGPERFDVLPLLVATDGAIAAFGHDGRRLRPNIVIGGVPGQAERDWPGSALQIGDVLIGVESLRGRCIVTTIDPDTGEQDVDVLREINRDFDGLLALNCWVARAGEIGVGDGVSRVPADLPLPPRGGWILGAPYEVETVG